MNDDVGIGTMLISGICLGIVVECPPAEKRHKNSECKIMWFSCGKRQVYESTYLDYGLVVMYSKDFLRVAS